MVTINWVVALRQVLPNILKWRVGRYFIGVYIIKYKNYNFLECDWFKKLQYSTNSLAKLLSDSLLLDSLLSDIINQSHSKL